MIIFSEIIQDSFFSFWASLGDVFYLFLGLGFMLSLYLAVFDLFFKK